MNSCWTMPEGPPNLVADRLQLWRISLGIASAPLPEIQILLNQAYAVLNTAERERAARMRAGATREEFIAGRGCLRRLLGSVLDADPRTLALEAGSHGKPFLRSRPGEVLPEFNLAHSRGVILIGLSAAGAIGVDVEYLDPGVELYDIARTAFHADDLARIRLAATQDEGLAAFYRCWTRKEAVAKADGRGLTLEPTSFAAGANTTDEQRVVLNGEIPPPHKFYVRGIDVGPDRTWLRLQQRLADWHSALLRVFRRDLPCFLPSNQHPQNLWIPFDFNEVVAVTGNMLLPGDHLRANVGLRYTGGCPTLHSRCKEDRRIGRIARDLRLVVFETFEGLWSCGLRRRRIRWHSLDCRLQTSRWHRPSRV